MHIHYLEEKCYDEDIFFYHLGCHQWVSAGESHMHRKFFINRSAISAFLGTLGMLLPLVYLNVCHSMDKTFTI